jgi:hypothetical protein
VCPVLHGGEVGRHGGLAVLEGGHGPLAEHGDGQTSGAADGLLACGDNAVELPLVKSDLLASDTAHAVDDEQGIRRDPVHKLGELLELAENTGRGVDVSHGDDLVLLLRQGLLDLGELRPATDGAGQLRDVGAVRLEAVGEASTEVASGKHQDVLIGLDEVCGDEVPAEGTRA